MDVTASSSVLPSWAQVQIVQYADEQGLVSSLAPAPSGSSPGAAAVLDLSPMAEALVSGQLSTTEAEAMIAGDNGDGTFTPLPVASGS